MQALQVFARAIRFSPTQENTFMITLKQLEAFYWIGQLGTFDRASTKLNTTQSAISKRIQELEFATGIPLFDRSQRSARFTEKGEQLLGLAEEILTLQHRIETLAQRDEAPARRLRLGITELTALTWLPRFISELRAAYPQLVIETEVALGRNLYDRLQEDMLDVIIVPDAFADPHFTAIHLARVQNVWMGSPKLVSTTGTLSIEKLTEFTLLVQGNRSGTGLWVSKWLQSEAAVVRRHYSSDSLIALLGMTVAGLGVTYLPVPCFASLVSEGKLMIIPTNPELPDIPYVAIYRKDRPNALAAKVANIAHMTCDFSSQLSDCFE